MRINPLLVCCILSFLYILSALRLFHSTDNSVKSSKRINTILRRKDIMMEMKRKAVELCDLTQNNDEVGVKTNAKSTYKRVSSDNHSNQGIWQPFYLTKVNGIRDYDNQYSLGIDDIISSDFDERNCDITGILLINFMTQYDWLLDAAPVLRYKSIPVVCLTGGNGNDITDKIRNFCSDCNFFIRRVHMPDQYGTQHSKIAIVYYRTGVRVSIMTNNYIQVDFDSKTQAVYVEDFPLKTEAKKGTSCEFEKYLRAYLAELKVHDSSTEGDDYKKDSNRLLADMLASLANYDFSSSQVTLVASVPGRHSSHNLRKYGHCRLNSVLSALGTSRSTSSAYLVLQISSISSMGNNDAFFKELTDSMEGTSTLGGTYNVQLVWPSVATVRDSLMGYASGRAIPCDLKHMYRDGDVTVGVKQCFSRNQTLCLWDGSPSGRAKATPHMKCYFPYRISMAPGSAGIVEMDWFLLTSSNLSMAAWGKFEKNKTQLYIKSFELGVLFHPKTLKNPRRLFSLTPRHRLLGLSAHDTGSISTEANNRRFVISQHPILATDITSESPVHFPVPFKVTPTPYNFSRDSPWVWRHQHPSRDIWGKFSDID